MSIESLKHRKLYSFGDPSKRRAHLTTGEAISLPEKKKEIGGFRTLRMEWTPDALQAMRLGLDSKIQRLLKEPEALRDNELLKKLQDELTELNRLKQMTDNYNKSRESK